MSTVVFIFVGVVATIWVYAAISFFKSFQRHKTPTAMQASSSTPASGDVLVKGSVGTCLVLGAIFLLIGADFLILHPSGEVESVVNLQRLAIGQSSSIVGAIFLAAGIRPR